jgi:hypothetical protein
MELNWAFEPCVAIVNIIMKHLTSIRFACNLDPPPPPHPPPQPQPSPLRVIDAPLKMFKLSYRVTN